MKRDRDFFREKLIRYTREAYKWIESKEKPYILDIGCGSGVATMELLRLTNGHVLAIDIDENALNRLRKKVASENLAQRIEILKISMFDLNVEYESFDIVWAEGSISFIGFEQGIKTWKKLIKKGGFLIIHADGTDIELKLNLLKKYGYHVVHHFLVPKQVWQNEYYEPMKNWLKRIRFMKVLNTVDCEEIKLMKAEIDFIEKTGLSQSVFFICKKTE